MARLILIGILAFACCGTLQAADCTQQQVTPLKAFAQEAITVSTSAVKFTVATFSPGSGGGAMEAFVTIATSDIRVLFDGTAPTSTTGHKFQANGTFTVCGPDIPNLQMIRDTGAGSDAVVTVSYLRVPGNQ